MDVHDFDAKVRFIIIDVIKSWEAREQHQKIVTEHRWLKKKDKSKRESTN